MDEIYTRVNASLDRLESAVHKVSSDREVLLSAVAAAADYLDCIPESAAGGDDDAVRIARMCRAALVEVRK